VGRRRSAVTAAAAAGAGRYEQRCGHERSKNCLLNASIHRRHFSFDYEDGRRAYLSQK
jgi:hypothetical protein